MRAQSDFLFRMAGEKVSTVRSAAGQIPEQGAVVEEVEAQTFWHRENPLMVAILWDYFARNSNAVS